MRTNIAFLVPYFGKLPPCFNIFLLSVADKHFDVLFFSDCHKPDWLPSNVKWYNYSFANMTELVSERLEHDIILSKPYKLCDLKPALGLIFSDYIKEYNFWGSIDIDLCVGNFKKFINASVLEASDVISGIQEYLSGSFFIIRNTNYHNNLFKKSKDWQSVFLNKQYTGFDECGGQFFKELKAGKTFREIKPTIESFTEVLFKEPLLQTRLCFMNVIAEPKKGATYVERNKVIYNKHEYLLVHYIYYKTWYCFYTNKQIRFPFFINRLGFFRKPPSLLNMLFSKNFRVAFQKKIAINLQKLNLHV